MNHIDNERKMRYKEIIAGFTMMHDVLARKVLKDPRCAETVLRVIMGKPNLSVTENTVQADLNSLRGRSCILDCRVVDSDGKLYDIEIQQDNAGATPERAEYHVSMMASDALEKGVDFSELAEIYVIFITRKDVIGEGCPSYAYEFRRADGTSMNGKLHIIYVPSCYEGTDALGRLMHDFRCTNPDDMYYGVLAESVRSYKEEGVDTMCSELENIKAEGRAEGRNEGRQEGALTTALKLATTFGFSVTQIAEAVSVDEATVAKWLAEAKIER